MPLRSGDVDDEPIAATIRVRTVWNTLVTQLCRGGVEWEGQWQEAAYGSIN